MIPQRSQAVANKIAMKLEILLPPKLTDEEHQLLKSISLAKTVIDLVKVVEFINLIENNDELFFIKKMINKR